jgi:hypothetical protein
MGDHDVGAACHGDGEIGGKREHRRWQPLPAPGFETRKSVPGFITSRRDSFAFAASRDVEARPDWVLLYTTSENSYLTLR